MNTTPSEPSKPPVLLYDFVGTLTEYQQGMRKHFPRECWLHPHTITEVLETAPAHSVKRVGDDLYIFGVKVRANADLGYDECVWGVPAFMVKKLIGVSRPPVLTDKPEYRTTEARAAEADRQ